MKRIYVYYLLTITIDDYLFEEPHVCSFNPKTSESTIENKLKNCVKNFFYDTELKEEQKDGSYIFFNECTVFLERWKIITKKEFEILNKFL